MRVLDAVRGVPGAHPLLCTAERAYYGEYAQPFVRFVQLSYISNGQRDLYETAAHEPVCKIAVYDEKGPENNCMKKLPPLLAGLRLTLSGGNWLDVSERARIRATRCAFCWKNFPFRRTNAPPSATT